MQQSLLIAELRSVGGRDRCGFVDRSRLCSTLEEEMLMRQDCFITGPTAVQYHPFFDFLCSEGQIGWGTLTAFVAEFYAVVHSSI